MIGLEALYADGAQGVMQQLIGKSRLLLGEHQKSKRLIQSMYQYRSRLLHGDMKIANRFNEADAEGYFSESYDSGLLATAVLVASLQQLVKRDTQTLGWDYCLKLGE
jgi:hypothetical protein